MLLLFLRLLKILIRSIRRRQIKRKLNLLSKSCMALQHRRRLLWLRVIHLILKQLISLKTLKILVQMKKKLKQLRLDKLKPINQMQIKKLLQLISLLKLKLNKTPTVTISLNIQRNLVKSLKQLIKMLLMQINYKMNLHLVEQQLRRHHLHKRIQRTSLLMKKKQLKPKSTKLMLTHLQPNKKL